MKKTATILFIIASSLVALVAIAFTIIEGRLVLSFDWSLHENEFVAFLQYLARLGISVLCLITGVGSIVYHHKKTFVFEGSVLVAIAVATLIFASNSFGIYFMILGSLYLGSSIFHRYAQDK